MRRRNEVGLAVGPDRIVAVRIASAGGERSADTVGTWAWGANAAERDGVLVQVLTTLRERHGVAVVHVSLLPPLAEVRLVALPSLPSDELRAAVAPDLRRYIPADREPHVLQVTAQESPEGSSAQSHLLSIAALGLVESVLRASDAAGLEVRSIGAALLAWSQASPRSDASAGPTWWSVRRSARVDAWKASATSIDAIRRHPRRAGASAENAAEGSVLATDDDAAYRLAAAHAALPDDRSLWPARVYEQRVRDRWRAARAWAIAAAALFVAAVGVQWWSERAQLLVIDAERARLRPAVASAMARRDSLAMIERSLDRLRGFRSEPPRWLEILSAVEQSLPEDASLVTLRGNGDTLSVAGEADRAAPVLETLSASPAFSDVRAESPFQQRIEQGEVVAERFLIGARVRRARGGS